MNDYFPLGVVEGDGFEPSKTKSTDLQSVAFGRSATLPYALELTSVVARTGIEPVTQGFSVLCSTD